MLDFRETNILAVTFENVTNLISLYKELAWDERVLPEERLTLYRLADKLNKVCQDEMHNILALEIKVGK